MINVYDPKGQIIAANVSRKSRNGKVSYKGKYYPLQVKEGACSAHIVVESKNSEIYRLYDNGGKTMDRYTCVFMQHKERDGSFEALGFNREPFHGIGMYCSAIPGRHLGKRITIDDLPPQGKLFVEQELKEYGYDIPVN